MCGIRPCGGAARVFTNARFGMTELELATAPAPAAARGVFETVLVLDGRPLHWERHRERLRASARALYGAEPAGDWVARVERLAARQTLARMRILATPQPGAPPIASVSAAPFARELVLPREEPALVAVRVLAGFGAHKLADRAWLGQIESIAGSAARPLLVSAGGALLETTRANVFVVRGGALRTPPLDGAILPGVTRAVAIELARAAGLEVAEVPVTVEDLDSCDAVLLTGSLRLLERCRVRSGSLGAEIAERLADALARDAGLLPQ
jgi:para-aminobenzoate synthetase / 4-amino-4-deoxychorismate lyase